MSSGWPTRPAGVWSITLCMTFSGKVFDHFGGDEAGGDGVGGDAVLAELTRPHLVMPITPALAAT